MTDAGLAGVIAWSPPLPANIDGPHEELSIDAGRPVFYALPADRGRARDVGAAGPLRLIGHLHGMCGAPSYACGKWLGAGTDVGVMVCPTGNARCGDSAIGPPSWEAPTWPELVAIMDKDLDAAVAKVEKAMSQVARASAISRDGAVLTGYSRGAYASPVIARKHPGRWPLLVLIEANVPLTAASLRASGVRAVALVAGEQGTEIAGMTKTQADLEQSGFPAKLFVMRRTGHLYSDDMEYVMHDALAFVLSHDRDQTDGGAHGAK
jgi:predicted esterase